MIIEELKILLREFEILKPSVNAEIEDEYKTAATNVDAARLNELRANITAKVDEIKLIANKNKAYNDKKPIIQDTVIIDSLNSKEDVQ